MSSSGGLKRGRPGLHKTIAASEGSPANDNDGNAKQGGMRKSLSAHMVSSLVQSVPGMRRTGSDLGSNVSGASSRTGSRGGQGMRNRSLSSQLLSGLHQEEAWEQHGGWRSTSRDSRKEYHMERDASMVQLLNLFDPDSLVDQASSPGHRAEPSGEDGFERQRSSSFEIEMQHSALSRRGVALVGGSAALLWYLVRLALRDLLSLGAQRKRGFVLELHLLSALHSVGWVTFLVSKLSQPTEELSKYCSRALVASLGFYLHDCWALRGTLLEDPTLLAHQASVATTIAAILRSKGVAWLAPALMSLSVPTLVQEFLQLCGTIGLPATRPEVRGLLLLWFISFAGSKIALVPLWMRHHTLPELHQPSLLPGKISYLLGLLINVRSLMSAARDLPRFLRPQGRMVSTIQAYRVPLRQADSLGTALVAGSLIAVIFGSYLTAPTAVVVAILALRRRGSSGWFLRLLAAAMCSVVAVDKLLPMPKEISPSARLMLPFFRRWRDAFRHEVLPAGALDRIFLRKDRHYLVAVSPHGLFPWGVAMVLIELLDHGFLPNLIGASVLGALPVAGRILRTFGFRPAEPKEIAACLRKEYPRNVTLIIPGGIGEMFSIRDDVEVSTANKRTGFIDIAIREKAVIVPAYMLGNSQLYRVAKGALKTVTEWLSRRLRTSLTLFHGRFFLLPYPHKLASAFGEPIDTNEVSDQRQVQKLFVSRLREAYETHRGAVGWSGRQLYFEGESLPEPRPDPLQDYADPVPRMHQLKRDSSKL